MKTTAAKIQIDRPHYRSEKVSSLISGNLDSLHFSEKMDGVFEVLEIGGNILTGERMKDGSFWAFDIAFFEGVDIRGMQWRERIVFLGNSVAKHAGIKIVRMGKGADFYREIVKAGGEGIVAKAWGGKFGIGWVKVKQRVTYDCQAEEKHASKSTVRLSMAGKDCGWCTIPESKMPEVRIGGVIEISCQKILSSGKFREASFIRTRPDKVTA